MHRHDLFIEPASEVLAAALIDRLVVTDRVLSFRLFCGGAVARKLRGVSPASALAWAITQCHLTWTR